MKALQELRRLDRKEFRRVVVGAVIDVQVKLRNEGEEFTTEFGGELYDQ